MSRRLKEVTQQAIRLHCHLHRIQAQGIYWQLSTTSERDDAQSAGTWPCASRGVSTAGISRQSEKTSSNSLSAAKIRSELLEVLRQTAAEHSGKSGINPSGLESVIESILKLGLSQAQVKQLLALNPKITAQPPQKSLAALNVLNLLGLNPGTMIKILEKCPELLEAKAHQLQPLIESLQKYGLGEGSLQRVLVHFPQILNLSAKQVNNTVRFFKDKCIFTSAQITEILRTSPNVLFEKFEELEYKFQYAYFRMGLKQSEIAKSTLFQVSLEELKQRHIFLERLGLYQTPDKKGQTQIVNPKPKAVLSTTEDHFLAKVARSTQEEFDIFKKLLSREEIETEELESLGGGDEEQLEEDYSSEEDNGPFQRNH